MAGIETFRARYFEAHELAKGLRPIEVEELKAAENREPLDIVLQCLQDSDEAHSVYLDGELACLWGVTPCPENSILGERRGVAWLLTTGRIEERPKLFWKHCLETLPGILDRWDFITNAIYVKHQQALRWGKRLGFRMMPPQAIGHDGALFVPFCMTRRDLCAQ